MPLAATAHISIPDDELVESFIRAPGPGGQNVNKVATAVQLRFDVLNSPSLPDAVKVRLMRLAGRRLTREGAILIAAKRFRTRERNRADARERLAALIARAAVPEKKRVRTKTPKRQKEKRLQEKKRRSEIKAGRKRPPQ